MANRTSSNFGPGPITVGLCVITEDLGNKLRARLTDLAPYFDAVYVQVNGNPAVYTQRDNDPLTTFLHPWDDNFADARNALLREVKTDYWVWMDTDDELANPENIRSVIEHMEATGVDIMFAPYHYMVTDQGTTELQNRERIVRTSLKGEWHGAIHETYIPEESATSESTDKVQWIHRKTQEEHNESQKRNRSILEREYNKEPRDPRIAYYLGLNYGMAREYDKAITCFRELIQYGGWDEERYRAYLQIFSCYFELGSFDEAVQAALDATTELPEYPDAYFMLQQVYYQRDDYVKSLEWFKVGKSKPIPKSDSAFNPLVRNEQPLYLAATSYLFIGQPQPAVRLLLELQKNYPDYKIPEAVKQTALDAYNEENAIDNAKKLIEFNQSFGGDPIKVLDSLPASLRADIRLTKERRELVPGKAWATGSIAIYCGASFEPWGPDTLDKGMGGSEEAIVYLSREFTKNKHFVTVFNERLKEYADPVEISELSLNVNYFPWTEINPNDTFDTFIAWRDPSICKEIKAKRVLCDLHDILPQAQVYSAIPHVDKFMFKSVFHRELYPEIPEDKVCIIGNGIEVSQF